MKILIDKQEQAPWQFSKGTDTLRYDLETGDYSIYGYDFLICVERKSMDDLVKTVIHDWLRFSRQLRRMAAMDHAAIIVEAPVMALFNRQYSSDANPDSVRGKLNSIFLKFGIPTLFLDTRETAALWTENLFKLYLEQKGAG